VYYIPGVVTQYLRREPYFFGPKWGRNTKNTESRNKQLHKEEALKAVSEAGSKLLRGGHDNPTTKGSTAYVL
jgi:hypothetical protein